nr:DUF1700 domain-containing protein [uncultured Clostridium sp.]
MNRDEFMRELEYLLADIPDEEKEDAIEYYRDYLEEAGTENEDSVIREFGSPERIAAMIRADMNGHLKDGGEFTESGYQDERFRDPNLQMAKRYDLPEVTEQPEKDRGYEQTGRKPARSKPRDGRRLIKIILWIILIIAASPMLFGIGGGIVGILAGLFGALFAAVVALGAVTFALLAAGFALAVAGFTAMIIHPLDGILLLGLGILILGLGIVSLAVCSVFYGKFLPFLFRSCINMVSRLLHGRRART